MNSLLANKKTGEIKLVKGFASEEQRKFMWAVHPEIAKKWAHDIPSKEKGPHRMPTGGKAGVKGKPIKSKKEKAKIMKEAKKLEGTGLKPFKKKEKMASVPKRDGSGRGMRLNRGRGGCKSTKEKGQGK